VFSFPDAVAGAVTTGARSGCVTDICVDAEPESVFDAVNVTKYIPDGVKKDGVHENVPDVFETFVVKVLPVVAGEEDAVNELIASPSGSFAVTTKLAGMFGVAETKAGAVTTGARSTLFTVIAVEAVPVSPLEAKNVTV
jgi:hypothetical protein